MRLDQMLATFPTFAERNEKILNMVNTTIAPPIIVQLLIGGLDPNAFASGINFILQHIAKEGLPEDWAEVCEVREVGPVLTDEDAAVSIRLENMWTLIRRA